MILRNWLKKNAFARSKGLFRVLGLGLIVLSLCTCTKLRIGYEYADLAIVYYLDDNFELDKDQRIQAKKAVAAYFKWHRKEMLPAYSNLLTQWSQGFEESLPPAKFDSCYKTYKILMHASLEPVLDKALILLRSLRPEQIDAWAEKQGKNNRKLRKDFSGDIEEKLATRYEKIVDELEDWTGPLLPDQKSRIKVLNGTLPWNGMFWLNTRELFYLRLLSQLKVRASESIIRKILADYFLEPEKLRTREYQLRDKEFQTRLRTIILVVYKMLTPVQKQHFINRLEKVVLDFEKLTAQEKAP